MKSKTQKLFEIIGIDPSKVKDDSHFITALTHSSYANENKVQSYERLEMLGDSILGFMVTEFIFCKFPNYNEEMITKLKALSVSNSFLSKIIKKHGINKLLISSNKILDTDSEKICGSIFESIVAAIFLEFGLNGVNIFLTDFLFNDISENAGTREEVTDYKTLLQEKLQASGTINSFNYDDEYNPQKKLFETKIIYHNIVYGSGTGKKKIQSQQAAAKDALEKLAIQNTGRKRRSYEINKSKR